MNNFIKVNKGLEIAGCPGIEAYFVKSTLAKYNYRAKFSQPDGDGIITVHTTHDYGLKPLDRIYEYLVVMLLVIADLKMWAGREYL